MRTATETQEDDNGGAVEVQDNEDDRKGQRQRQSLTSMVAEMQDNRDGYGGRGDAGQQQKLCGMTEIAKWVGRTETDYVNIDRGQLPT